jgi:hypothetical protein
VVSTHFVRADAWAETWLPSAFSSIKWQDVSGKFLNLLNEVVDNHNRIPTYTLRRSRIPMIHYRKMINSFEKSRKRSAKAETHDNKQHPKRRKSTFDDFESDAEDDQDVVLPTNEIPIPDKYLFPGNFVKGAARTRQKIAS